MKIKVCGMTQPANFEQVAGLYPDMLGFIFYKKSKRFAGDLDPSMVNNLMFRDIQKVGVFVDASLQEVFATIDTYELDLIQLHGSEPPAYCREINSTKTKVVKAFGIDPSFDINQTKAFENACSYFLFDTKIGNQSGGTGQQFNWQILEKYALDTPFLLSGGIGPDDSEAVLQFHHPRFWGIDINSKFEVEPGLKDITQLKTFIRKIRNNA